MAQQPRDIMSDDNWVLDPTPQYDDNWVLDQPEEESWIDKTRNWMGEKAKELRESPINQTIWQAPERWGKEVEDSINANTLKYANAGLFDKDSWEPYARGVVGAGAGVAGKFITDMTTPLNLAAMLASGGSSALLKKAPVVAEGLETIARLTGIPQMLGGGAELASAKSLPEAGMAGANLLFGGLNTFGPSRFKGGPTPTRGGPNDTGIAHGPYPNIDTGMPHGPNIPTGPTGQMEIPGTRGTRAPEQMNLFESNRFVQEAPDDYNLPSVPDDGSQQLGLNFGPLRTRLGKFSKTPDWQPGPQVGDFGGTGSLGLSGTIDQSPFVPPPGLYVPEVLRTPPEQPKPQVPVQQPPVQQPPVQAPQETPDYSVSADEIKIPIEQYIENLKQGGLEIIGKSADGLTYYIRRMSSNQGGADNITPYILNRIVNKLRQLLGREPTPNEIQAEATRRPEGETTGRVAPFGSRAITQGEPPDMPQPPEAPSVNEQGGYIRPNRPPRITDAFDAALADVNATRDIPELTRRIDDLDKMLDWHHENQSHDLLEITNIDRMKEAIVQRIQSLMPPTGQRVRGFLEEADPNIDIPSPPQMGQQQLPLGPQGESFMGEPFDPWYNPGEPVDLGPQPTMEQFRQPSLRGTGSVGKFKMGEPFDPRYQDPRLGRRQQGGGEIPPGTVMDEGIPPNPEDPDEIIRNYLRNEDARPPEANDIQMPPEDMPPDLGASLNRELHPDEMPTGNEDLPQYPERHLDGETPEDIISTIRELELDRRQTDPGSQEYQELTYHIDEAKKDLANAQQIARDSHDGMPEYPADAVRDALGPRKSERIEAEAIKLDSYNAPDIAYRNLLPQSLHTPLRPGERWVSRLGKYLAKIKENETGAVQLPSWQGIKKATGWGQGVSKSKKVASEEPTIAAEVARFAGAAMTGGDLSAGRQALSTINTRHFWKSLPSAVRSMTAAGWDKVNAEIMASRIHQETFDPATGRMLPSVAARNGLDMYTPASHPSAHAREVASKWLETGAFLGPEKYNPIRWAYNKTGGKYIRATNRAYITMLNKIRTDTAQMLFDRGQDMALGAVGARGGRYRREGMLGDLGFKKTYTVGEAVDLDPYLNSQRAREIVDFVNTATGQAPLKGYLLPFKQLEINMERHTDLLAKAFFSPGLAASRMRLLSPATYAMASPFVRKQYAKALLGTALGWYGFTMTSKMAADAMGIKNSINWDPTNPDFGKHKIGNTRMDYGAGFLQFMVLTGRLIAGGWTSSNSPNARFRPFGKGFQPETRLSTVGRFVVNKLHPTPKYVLDLMAAAENKPFPMVDRSTQMISPLFFQDAYEILKEKPELIPWMFPVYFGAGTQTYGKFGDPREDLRTRIVPPKYEIPFRGGPLPGLNWFNTDSNSPYPERR